MLNLAKSEKLYHGKAVKSTVHLDNAEMFLFLCNLGTLMVSELNHKIFQCDSTCHYSKLRVLNLY
jgi:hypothetical protein